MNKAILLRVLVVASLGVCATTAIAQVSLGQTDTFDSGTAAWQGANPSWVSTGGPGGAGDGFLQLLSTGGGGSNSHMAGYNSSQWSGNFIAAGVTMISADFENLGSTQLAMRLVFFDPSVSTQWESNAVYLLNPNSGWQHASFAIDQADFTQVEGSTSFSDTLSQVNRMMFRHNPNLDSGGVSIVGTLGIDNVHAGVVPEPASLAVLSLGVLAILRKRK